MRAKAAQALCLLNIGLLVAVQPLLAYEPPKNSKDAKPITKQTPTLNADQKLQIRLAEEELRAYEKEHGATVVDFPNRLGDLARVYIINGQIAQAERTISRALDSAKTFRAPELIIPGLMSNYAFEMAPYDKVKARQAATIGLEFANKLPFGSSERLGYLFNLISLFKRLDAPNEANKQIADLDEQLHALEKANGLDERMIESTADTLSQMSTLYCLPNKTGSGDFKRAESYQLRAIAQYDKLPKDKRLMAHVHLQQWYQGFGMDQKSIEQGNVIKSLNNGKPYVRRVCHGCGMG